MKKSIFFIAALLISIATSPIFAQTPLPGDPEGPPPPQTPPPPPGLPIDHFWLLMVLVALLFGLYKISIAYKKNHTL